MRIAVVTPYHDESPQDLARCVESVRRQRAAATHILVADGEAREWVGEASDLRHIILDTAHHDYGGTARLTGFLTAVSEGFDAVAFLDADHRFLPGHLAACRELAAADPAAGLIIARRRMLRTDGTELPVTPEELDGNLVDPSCQVVLAPGFAAIAAWGTARKAVTRDEAGQAFIAGYQGPAVRALSMKEITVESVCRAESVYRFLAEEPPEDHEPVHPQPIWLLGDGRSGTTWLFELLNHHYRYRAYFEPFNPQPSKQVAGIGLHHYLSPNDEMPELEKRLSDIFSGRFNEERKPTYHSPFYERVLVKDIYALLLAYWAHLRFPELIFILIVRNPFSVAASKLNLQHWFPESSLDVLLRQERLVEDHLQPHYRFLKSVARNNDFVLDQIAIWAVVHYVIERQFSTARPGRLFSVSYESLRSNPTNALSKILSALSRPGTRSAYTPSQLVLERPSGTTRPTFVPKQNQVIPVNRHEKWQYMLSRRQIRDAYELLERFGLQVPLSEFNAVVSN